MKLFSYISEYLSDVFIPGNNYIDHDAYMAEMAEKLRIAKAATAVAEAKLLARLSDVLVAELNNIYNNN
jgi:deoxyhypusine synthase